MYGVCERTRKQRHTHTHPIIDDDNDKATARCVFVHCLQLNKISLLFAFFQPLSRALFVISRFSVSFFFKAAVTCFIDRSLKIVYNCMTFAFPGFSLCCTTPAKKALYVLFPFISAKHGADKKTCESKEEKKNTKNCNMYKCQEMVRDDFCEKKI